MFWNDPGLEIKKSFQWQGFIDFKDDKGASTGLTIKPFLISSWTKPVIRFSNEEVISKIENNITYSIKGSSWEPITVTIIDTITNEGNTTFNVFNWLVANGYDARSFNNSDDSEKQNFYTSLGKNTNQATLYLSSLSPSGKEYEKWTFKNPTVRSIDFGGTLDYSKTDMLKVTIRFHYVAADYIFFGLGQREAETETRRERDPTAILPRGPDFS